MISLSGRILMLSQSPWGMQCVTTIKYSVLVNGVLIDNFTPSREIRQEDSISPYLFLLGVEGLSALLLDAESRGRLQG